MKASSSSPWIVEARGIRKVYPKGVHALRGADVRLAPGEIFGLLGPNGAGKSTLVKILLGLVKASGGQGHVLGEGVGSTRALQRVGYLPEHLRFPDYLKSRQIVEFTAAMNGVDRPTRRNRAMELLELTGMRDWADAKIANLSKGMKQRVGIAQALANEPKLVILDEPTDGVDPVGRRDIRLLLQELKRRGQAVLLNSHLLSELEMVCDRVAILVQGQVVREGTLAELTREGEGYEVVLAGGEDALALARATAPDAHIEHRAGGEVFVRLATGDPGPVQPLLARALAQGVRVLSVRSTRPSLEDLFMLAVTDPTTGLARPPGAARRAAEPTVAAAAKEGTR